MDKALSLARYKIKASIFETGLYDEVKKANRINFRYGDRGPKNDLEAIYGDFLVRMATNMYQANNKRYNRVLKHIDNLLSLPGCEWVFCTLTFNDETLANTSPATRRKYVARWCKKVSAIYVANVDYGKKNNREHYHAIVCNLVDKEANEAWKKYGFTWFRRIKADRDCPKERLSKYLTKLTAHALKETAKSGLIRIIYSRRCNVDWSQLF